MTMNSKLILIAASTMVLAACTSAGSVKTGNDTLSAVVTRELVGPDKIEVTLNGKVYRGDWQVGPPSKEQTQGETFRHRRHMHSAKNILKADDGSGMECQWKTHLYAADGSCVADGREYPLSLRQQ
jgi:hypothetical protein